VGRARSRSNRGDELRRTGGSGTARRKPADEQPPHQILANTHWAKEPEDSQGNVVGLGDLAAQARQVFANLGRALAVRRRARTDQVAKITIFVACHRPEYLPVLEDARVSVFDDHKPVDTLVGVESLGRPEYLIEVDTIADTDV
jgi:enamine deaminase RidA (YjgF/YER057c/UK114 family)